jgi:hypothetical protein
MSLRLNAHLSTQSNLLDLFTFGADRMGTVLLQRAEGWIKTFICEKVQKLVELFVTYAVTASSVKEVLQAVGGVIGLLAVGKLDLNLPSVDALPLSFISEIKNTCESFFRDTTEMCEEKAFAQYFYVSLYIGLREHFLPRY